MIRQLLGPIYGRLQAEWYAPMINRCFGLAFRAGILPMPPQSLADKQFHVTFISPMAKAQKLEEVTAVESTVASVAQLAAATQDPTIWDSIDVAEGIRIIADGRGAPAKLLRTSDDVATIRKQRASAQQQAAQQQQAQELAAPMMQQLAKNTATA